MKFLRDIPTYKGVRILLRVDFNVPMRNGVIADDFRIRVTLPTIEFLTSRGAKVVLISHAEANDGSNSPLEPIVQHLRNLGIKVNFIKNIRNARTIIDGELKNGECVLVENLRMFGDGEKKNDKDFAKELASLGDVYVNGAFSVSHREHASVVSVPKYIPSYAGLQFEREVINLSKAFNPTHPFLFILGGAKFETKLPLIQKFSDIVDGIFIGGALANDFFKARGYETGKSLLSDGETTEKAITGFIDNPKLMVPIDVVVNIEKDVKMPATLQVNDKILDSGPKTLQLLQSEINSAKLILWNGPLGYYEGGYTGPTLELAKMLSEATLRGAETIVGGGDTLAAIESLGIQDKFTFISTGGGAMLDFLAKGTLPGIEALNESATNSQ